MSRAIDGTVLTDWISGECKSPSCPTNESAFGMRIMKHIERMPTIESERKPGKWIHGKELSREMISDCVIAIFYDGWKCSECDCLVEEEREPLYKYCPYCGAKMEGVRSDGTD